MAAINLKMKKLKDSPAERMYNKFLAQAKNNGNHV